MVTAAMGPIFANAASMDASSADCGMSRTNTAVTGSCVIFSPEEAPVAEEAVVAALASDADEAAA